MNIEREAERIAAEGESTPRPARDPVNQAMINNWIEAIGDTNPVYVDPEFAAASIHGHLVAPPAMAQVWTMNGLNGKRADDDPLGAMMAVLDQAGFTSVVATNSEQTYRRYLRHGERVSASTKLEAVTGPKRTALGEGWFVTTRTTWYVGDEAVAEMLFRVLKFRPATRPPGIARPATASNHEASTLPRTTPAPASPTLAPHSPAEPAPAPEARATQPPRAQVGGPGIRPARSAAEPASAPETGPAQPGSRPAPAPATPVAPPPPDRTAAPKSRVEEPPTEPASAPQPGAVHPLPDVPSMLRPVISRDTEFFWDGTRSGELRIQRWGDTLRHPPGPMPPDGDLGAKPDYVVASGRGTVYSYVVHHRPAVPGKRLPFVIALVELEEGVRMLGELVDADPATVFIGQPVRVVFRAVDDRLTLPAWRPADGETGGER